VIAMGLRFHQRLARGVSYSYSLPRMRQTADGRQRAATAETIAGAIVVISGVGFWLMTPDAGLGLGIMLFLIASVAFVVLTAILRVAMFIWPVALVVLLLVALKAVIS
jgi:hypothetical protein